jgi:hypothetical protein
LKRWLLVIGCKQKTAEFADVNAMVIEKLSLKTKFHGAQTNSPRRTNIHGYFRGLAVESGRIESNN